MYIPVQQRYLSNSRNYNKEQVSQVERMSVEEMKDLLIMMGTITVISFILVVSIVTILAAFVWYSRRRLSGVKCTCNVKQTAADDQWSCMEEARQHYQQQNIPVIKDVIHAGYVYPVGGSAAGYTNPVMPLYPSSCNSYPPSLASYPVSNGAGRLMEPDCWSQEDGGGSVTRGSMRSRIVVPSPPSLLGGGNNVIVNPLPPLPLQETTMPGDNTTTIIINHNKDETDGNNRNVVINQVNDDTNVDPIYQEIGAATKQKVVHENDENPPKEESSEEDANTNTVAKNGQKKEVEYWQITAKEVVKFRPCTETFIRRNDV